jgi:hypothetical protein
VSFFYGHSSPFLKASALPKLTHAASFDFDRANSCDLFEMRGAPCAMTEFAAEDRNARLMQIATAREPHFQRFARVFMKCA